MPSSFPFMPMFTRDWLSSSGTRRMSLAERGAFFDLLCYQWEDGSIPNRDSDVAAMLGLDPLSDTFKTIWFSIEGKFEEIDGVLVNKRLAFEREKRMKVVQTKRAAGALGGRPLGSKKPNNNRKVKQIKTKRVTKPKPLQNTDLLLEKEVKGALTFDRTIPHLPESFRSNVRFMELFRTHANMTGISLAIIGGKARGEKWGRYSVEVICMALEDSIERKWEGVFPENWDKHDPAKKVSLNGYHESSPPVPVANVKAAVAAEMKARGMV